MFDAKGREKSLEPQLRDRVKKQGGIALKFYCLSFTGIPDRLVLMPGGRLWFVELKSKGKKPKDRQLLVHGFLQRLGFEVWVIDNQDVLELFLFEIQFKS